MPRTSPVDPELALALGHLAAAGDDAPPVEEKIELLRSLRERLGDRDGRLDEFLVQEISALRAALEKASGAHRKLNALVEKLTAPPYHPAVFLGMTPTRRGEAAVVHHGNTRRVVTVGEGVDLGRLAPGDEVLLGSELNVVLDASVVCVPRVGETAEFERTTADGRIVLRYRDEEIVVSAAGSFDSGGTRPGDRVRWDRHLWMAFEKVERSTGDRLFLEETPDQSFADIGGLDAQIDTLIRWVSLRYDHADTARKYECGPGRGPKGVLLTGPPGTGKTMLARGLARFLADRSPSGRSRFMNIKPAALHSVWFSQSEANYREAFRAARQAAASEPHVPVVMFFDEVDGIGAARGSSLTQVHDRVIDAFMAELQGLEARGNVLVLAATNRPDVLDPGLVRPGRLGDDIVVPRPNREAARDIFSKYLHPDIPTCVEVDGRETERPHQVLIESVLSRVYSANGESELAKITFRDGEDRTITTADLVSGAVIAKIARDGLERACVREIETGDVGVRLEDLLAATDDEFRRASRLLTPRNCRKYVDDLPQDVDVVRVQPVERKVERAHRFLRLASPQA